MNTYKFPNNKSNKLIIFISGLDCDYKYWDYNRDEKLIGISNFAQSISNVIIFEIPLNTFSDNITFDEILSNINKECNNDIENDITIVGHSLGGLLSLLYVNKYPYKVKKLILLDITTPTPIGINYLNKLYLREKDNDKISYYMNIIKNVKDIKNIKYKLFNNIHVIVHVNIPLKIYLKNNNLQENIKNLNMLLVFYNLFTHNYNSNIITHLNSIHDIHHKEYKKIIKNLS